MVRLERHGLAAADFPEIGMGGEERRDLLRVLLGLVRAGGVDEASARLHVRRRRLDDLALEGDELREVVRVPAPARVGAPADHARVRARRVHEHAVEERTVLDVLHGGDVVEFRPREVFLQPREALRVDFLRHDATLPWGKRRLAASHSHPPRDLNRLAARGGAEVEHGESRRDVKQIHGARRGGILHDEIALLETGLVGHLLATRQLLERTGARNPCLGRRVVPAREFLRALRAVTFRPTRHKRVRIRLALRERRGGELRLELGTPAEEVAQDAVHHAVEPFAAVAELRGGDGLVHGGEVRHVRHVEDLRRAHEQKRLEFALRPRLEEFAQHGAERTEPAHRGVDEILHERAVGTALRQHLVRKLMRREPAGDDEGGCTAAVHATAMASISIFTSFGRRAACTQLRAGFVSPNSSAYTALTTAKSFMSLTNTVVLTTLSRPEPAASSTFWRLVIAWRAWSAAVVATTAPAAGSIGICPEQKMKPLARMAWL